MLGKKCYISFIFISQKSFFREKKIYSACGTKIFNVFFYISQNHFFLGKKMQCM